MRTESADSIRQSVEIDAPIQTVWNLMSEPGWWINGGALEPHEVRQVRQPDGTCVAEVRSAAVGFWRLVVVELREPEYAAFRWAPHAAADRDATGPTGSTLVEFTLREGDHPGRVVVEVVESGFSALNVAPDEVAANYRDNVGGWGVELALLRALATSA